MIFEGKIIRIIKTETGISQTGNVWSKTHYLMTQNDKYNTKLKFTVFGKEKNRAMNLQVDELVRLEGYVETTEWNDKFFTEVRITKRLEGLPEAPKQDPF